jgi:hypothetical protein
MLCSYYGDCCHVLTLRGLFFALKTRSGRALYFGAIGERKCRLAAYFEITTGMPSCFSTASRNAPALILTGLSAV